MENFGAENTDANDQNDEETLLLDGDPADGADDEATNTDDSDESSNEFDPEAALEELRAGTMSKSDFETFKQGLNRQLGQVKSLQSDISKLKQSQVDPDVVATDSEMLGALIAALPSVLDTSDPAFATLRALQERRAQAEVTRDAIAKIREESGDTPASDDGTGNGLDAQTAAAWNEASGLVNGYAKAKGIDPSSIEKAVWDKAVSDSMGMPDRAAELMYEVIDGLVSSTDTKQTNRAARKAAGNAGTPGKNGSGGGSTLTLAKLRGMTPEQIMKLPQEEVNAVLAQA